MNPEDRRHILEMLSGGKITVEEAERLLHALNVATPEFGSGSGSAQPASAKKFLRVEVDNMDEHSGQQKVNIRVPIGLLRAGVKLASLIPDYARHKVNDAMAEQGIKIDLTKLKPEDIDGFISELSDLTVDVSGNRDAKVRVYCE